MLKVRHCGELMRCEITPLKTGGKRYDLICGHCGHHEREIHTSTGRSVAWVNVSLQEKLAREKAALAGQNTAA